LISLAWPHARLVRPPVRVRRSAAPQAGKKPPAAWANSPRVKLVCCYERYSYALNNGVLGIQYPGRPGVMLYLYPLGNGVTKGNSSRNWGTPFNSFWCVLGVGVAPSLPPHSTQPHGHFRTHTHHPTSMLAAARQPASAGAACCAPALALHTVPAWPCCRFITCCVADAGAATARAWSPSPSWQTASISEARPRRRAPTRSRSPATPAAASRTGPRPPPRPPR
jgi:hypothetical protein